MLRCLTKLSWNLDYSDLCEAIHLVTPKAKFMIEKQTDFRKGLDFVRTARKAKLRELVTPFVKFCKAENVKPLVDHFILWKKNFVEDETYLVQYNIERIFGTSLLLYVSSMRANNYKLLKDFKENVFNFISHQQSSELQSSGHLL